jgi:hypothetical protein
MPRDIKSQAGGEIGRGTEWIGPECQILSPGGPSQLLPQPWHSQGTDSRKPARTIYIKYREYPIGKEYEIKI